MSRSSYGYVQFVSNMDVWLTLDVTVTDSEGSVAFGSTQIFVYLISDNTLFLEQFVRLSGTKEWHKEITAMPGDIIDVKICVETVGSDTAALFIQNYLSSTYGVLSYIKGSATMTPHFMYEDPSYGLEMMWGFGYVEPETSVEILYTLQVNSDGANSHNAILQFPIVTEAFLYPLSRGNRGMAPVYAGTFELGTISVINA